MIRDADDNELIYWPISGLIEGESSEVLTFTIEIPNSGSNLSATIDARVKIWAKRTADLVYIDISDDPYSLEGLNGDVEFMLYVEAIEPIVGLERVAISVVAGISTPALWR